MDDDAEARAGSIRYLADRQCAAVGVGHADLARHLKRDTFSLVVAKLRFTPGDGIAVLRQIRARSAVPVILVVSEGCTEAERILYIELGADDVLCGRLNPRELLARIRATLRRQEIGRRSVSPAFRGGYRFEGWELDLRSRTLKDPAGRIVKTTMAEYALLSALLEAPGRPLSRARLIRATRAHEDVHDRTIDAQVRRLRHRIEVDPSAPKLIRTRRGAGYVLDASVEILF
ncbi:response regulator transcription factor [Pararoseomonas sp. SCSIO 73927]|uniref:response regulator transcription factor n=1 Tax=Pararoseomonas sp. SCSIO 73927 TaxID=3114537 RepID=UPI0030CF980D